MMRLSWRSSISDRSSLYSVGEARIKAVTNRGIREGVVVKGIPKSVEWLEMRDSKVWSSDFSICWRCEYRGMVSVEVGYPFGCAQWGSQT